MKRVYVAGPYSSDPVRNTREAIDTGNHLLVLGFMPLIPHGQQYPHAFAEWIAYDLVWLRQCEAIYRMPGPSPGADMETAEAKRLGIPVFTRIDDLRAWAETGKVLEG